MTRRLILLRHAKSGWDNPLDSDHMRPLTSGGRAAALKIGRWLTERGDVPDEAMISSAKRTLETWSLLKPMFERVSARSFDALYHAGPETMLQVLRQATGKTVLMLGHNPGIAEFADIMLRDRPRHAEFSRYPAGATLIAEFGVDTWADVQPGGGEVVDFVVPRDLPEATA